MVKHRNSNLEISIDINDNSDQNSVVRPNNFGIRHAQVALLFFCLAIAFGYGSNLSLVMVVMVNNTANPSFEQLNWDEPTRGIIFSSSFWAFFFSSMFGGMIAQKYGGKSSLLCTMITKSFLVIVTPALRGLIFKKLHLHFYENRFLMSFLNISPRLAILGWQYMVAKQVIEGFVGGLVFPCVHEILSKWIHPIERGSLAPIALTGSTFGTILMTISSGYIATSNLGWPATFYIPGCCGIIWSILWMIFGANSPTDCKRLSNEEQTFLESIPGITKHKQSIPWQRIFSSKPVWALIVAQFGESWVFVMLHRSVPTYIDSILNIDVKSNSIFSALPYGILFIMILVSSKLATFFIQKEWTSVQLSRKIFNSFGMWLPAICLIALSFSPINRSLIIFLITLSIGLNASTHSGFVINHLDLSPNFASILVGIYISIGNFASIASPLLVGYVVTDTHDLASWRIVFIVSACIFIVSNLIFIIFGRADIQDWNESKVKVVVNKKIKRSDSTCSDDGINFREYMKRVKLS